MNAVRSTLGLYSQEWWVDFEKPYNPKEVSAKNCRFLADTSFFVAQGHLKGISISCQST